MSAGFRAVGFQRERCSLSPAVLQTEAEEEKGAARGSATPEGECTSGGQRCVSRTEGRCSCRNNSEGSQKFPMSTRTLTSMCMPWLSSPRVGRYRGVGGEATGSLLHGMSEPEAYPRHYRARRGLEPNMNGTEDLLVTSIEEMVVRAAKKLVEHRLLLAGLPHSKRRAQHRELERRREVIERLVALRRAMNFERPPGPSPAGVANKRAPQVDGVGLR